MERGYGRTEETVAGTYKESMNTIVKYSWERYLQCIGEVVTKLRLDNYIPDHLVAIARGGLLIGMRLSYLFEKPLAIMAAENWPDGKKAEEVTFARHMVYKTDTVSGRILLCDDLTETGETIQKSKNYLLRKFPKGITQIRTAVVIHKEWSLYVPDYYGEVMKQEEDGSRPWILQPTENPEIYLT